MTTPDEMPVTGFTATQAHELVAAGRGVLVDTRDARLFDNARAAARSHAHSVLCVSGRAHKRPGGATADRGGTRHQPGSRTAWRHSRLASGGVPAPEMARRRIGSAVALYRSPRYFAPP